MTLGVGVVGVGVLGRRHAENVARLGPRARLVAVADVNGAAAEAAARDLGCDWTADPHELLARPDVQAVIIVTGSDTHAALTVAAAERGKDILCEKPLALSVADARAAAEAADRAGVRLQVGFMRRYDPAYRAAHDAIERGEIGRPVIFAAISRDAQPPPRAYFAAPGTGGLFTDSGIHDLDLARWLMRDEVTTVSATGALVACHDMADVQPIDLGLATLTFRGGAVGAVQVYRRAVYGYDIRTEVVGTEGYGAGGRRSLALAAGNARGGHHAHHAAPLARALRRGLRAGVGRLGRAHGRRPPGGGDGRGRRAVGRVGRRGR